MHEPDGDIEARLRERLDHVVADGPDPTSRHAVVDARMADRQRHFATRRRLLTASAAAAVVGTGGVAWSLLRTADDDHSQPVAAGPDSTADPTPESAWQPVATAPLSLRSGPAVVWTEDRLVVWGGAQPGSDFLLPSDGASWSPETDEWTPIAPAPAGRIPGGFAIWDGSEVITGAIEGDSTAPWNASGGASEAQYGLAAYSPSDDSWRYIAPTAPAGDESRQAVTVNDGLVIAPRNVNPASSPPGLDVEFLRTTDGERATIDPGPFAASPYSDRSGTVTLANVDGLVVATTNWDLRPWILDPETWAWQQTPPWLTISSLHLLPATPTGTTAVYFASDGAGQTPLTFDPRVEGPEAFRSGTPNPFARAAWGHEPTWTGIELHVPGAAYDPNKDTWRQVPPPPRDPGRQRTLESRWTGEALLLFGGEEFSCPDDASCDRTARPDDLDGWLLPAG